MAGGRLRVWVAIAIVIVCAGADRAAAQNFEIAPFGGIRFGHVFFDPHTGYPLETGAAPAFGVSVDVPLSGGMQVEAAFSHQNVHVTVPGQPFPTTARVRIDVDHWQAGGLQEFGVWNRARPFLTGVLGLTRYGTGAENAFRFTAGAGGGTKLYVTDRLGVRLEGKVFATFLDADGTTLACSSGRGCVVALHVDVAWQAEFTAGLVLRLH